MVIVLALLPARKSEPTYEGKSLSKWLAGYEIGTSAAERETDQAIRHMGTNTLPYLLPMLWAKDSTAKVWIIENMRRWHIHNFNYTPAITRNERASRAFWALGTIAEPALPSLARDLDNPDKTLRAADVIGTIGPAGLPWLTNALANPNDRVRAYVIGGAFGIYATRPADAYKHYGIQDDESYERVAAIVMPILMKYLQDPDAGVRAEAVGVLGLYHKNPDRIVPILAALLDDRDENIRLAAARALGRFGRAAAPALPALKAASQSKDYLLRRTAEDALGIFKDDQAGSKTRLK
jgi:hypothetical protein